MATLELSNSVTAVDFDKEVKGLLLDTAHANGRELKLAVAIYGEPAHFNINDLLSITKINGKSKADRQREALAKYSETFAAQMKNIKHLSDVAKNKNVKTDARMKAEIDVAPLKAALTAAVSMFDRALASAYYMKHTTAIVTTLAKDGKSITLNYPKMFERGEGDKAVSVAGSEILSRGDIHGYGKALAQKNGLLAASKTSTKSGAGDKGVQVSQSTALTSMTMAADMIASLPKDKKDDVLNDKAYELAWVKYTRALFNGNGVIKVSEILETLRKSEAFAGCSIEIDVKPATAAPVKKSA